MAAESLRDELLAVPGVAEAEVDESGTNPSGVRVRLAPEADAQAVGIEVQRILASHGMRSRVNDEHAASANGDGTAPVVALPTVATIPPMPSSAPPLPEAMAFVGPDPADEPVHEGPAAAPDATLAGLRVDESLEGIVVTAMASDGRSFTEQSDLSESGMYDAVVSVVGALADGRAPTVLDVERRVVDGTEVVSVILERADGTRFAGSAVVRVGRAFAAARATWSALRAG
ncbi:MAG TPA: hypothetical protein VLD62_04655 [Acidimicrobiia bacterium]|nr:hypothetical protein [Acidimicrobiia bacterium]